VTRTYRCRSCGATWLSYPPGKALEPEALCLRCDGVLVLEDPPGEDPRAETDAPPPVPNGLEDDAET
jgi:hypothetical protein